MIIRGGENIASMEIEKDLARHLGIIEAAVIDVEGERRSERKVGSVITDQTNLARHEVIHFAQTRLDQFKARPCRNLEEMLRISTGELPKALASRTSQ